jgi:tetratricopeptide (TPR) repeat protein
LLQDFFGAHWKALVIGAAAVALLAVTLRSLWYPRQLQTAGMKPGSVIMVALTDNATGEREFDGITAALRADFRQSSRFNLWDDQRFSEALRAMRLEPQTKPDAKQWRQIAFREKARLLVFSTLSRLSDGYSFSVQCEQIGSTPESPVQRWQDTETASGPAALFEAVHRAATAIRTLAGENATEISATNRLPQDITSTSWEALELYGEAQSLSDQQRSGEAVPLLRRATQLDANFAMGVMRLGDILNAQDKTEEGFANWRKAIVLAETQHLSDHERFNIESRYALEVKDFDKAEPILRDWARRFPNDPLAAHLLAWCLLQLGNYEESVRVARDSQQRFPATIFGTSVLIRGLGEQNQLAEIDPQIAILEKLSAGSLAMTFRGTVAAMRGEYDVSERLFQEVMRSSDLNQGSIVTSQLAMLEADRGMLDTAQQILNEGIERDRKSGQDGNASQKTAALAFLEGISGHPKLAAARAHEAVSLRPSPLVIVQAVAILARYGSPKDATRIMNTYPAGEGSKYEADHLRMMGEILAAKGDLKPALERFERAANLDRRHEPKEYLARALDLAGERDRAKLMYQRIVDTSLLTWFTEDEWPATRFMARKYLNASKGQ